MSSSPPPPTLSFPLSSPHSAYTSGWHIRIPLHVGRHENRFPRLLHVFDLSITCDSDWKRPPMPQRWNAVAVQTGFWRLFQLHLLFLAAKENLLFADSCYCDNTSSECCTAMCELADHGKAASYCHNSQLCCVGWEGGRTVRCAPGLQLYNDITNY